MESITLTHQDYTIGWICALEVELTAARGMLDKEHGDLPPAPNDSNTYTLGRIGKHNIVITCLPEGSIGIVSAATVAANLLRSFGNVRFGLMVGIGGGAPGPPNEDARKDVRLGDVVVSTPWEASGGVIHYDFSVTLDGGQSIRIGHNDAPPSILRGAVTKLRSNMALGGLDFRQFWIDMLERYPSLEDLGHVYPGDTSDQLFLSEYLHRSNEDSCKRCDALQTVQRKARKRPEQPVVHYGLIGSTNQLLMSASRRDELREQYKLICFEMEASGLMNDFPCLIIRGVCDYCDGHKNKTWQPYAAGMAAAYAKALLAVILPTAVSEQKLARDLLETVEDISATTKATYDTVNDLVTGKLSGQLPYASRASFDAKEDLYATDQRCLQDLRITDPRDDKIRIEAAKGGLLDAVYVWIKENKIFKLWLTSPDCKVLWITGDAGKGKTMLLCGIINELKQTPTVYFFFQATDVRLNNGTSALRGLMFMLVRQAPALMSIVREAYDQAGSRLFEDRNAWYALSRMFLKMLASPLLGGGTNIVLDALDECQKNRDELLQLIVSSARTSSVKWIISSRNWPVIEKGLEHMRGGTRLSLELNEASVSAAISTYIHYNVEQLDKRHHYDHVTKVLITGYLQKYSGNTFLWVALACQHLMRTKRWKAYESLKTLPPGIDELYQRMMEILLESEEADVLMKILSAALIVFRPLDIQELTKIANIPRQIAEQPHELQDLIYECGSFLIYRNNTVQFVHASAQEYLSAQDRQLFPEGKNVAHSRMFQRSADAMFSTLRCNVYDLSHAGLDIEAVKVPMIDPLQEVKYSCVYFLDHFLFIFANKSASLEDCRTLYTFFMETWFQWLEAMSLMRSSTKAIQSITEVYSQIQSQGISADAALDLELDQLSYDAYRFVAMFGYVIQQYPLQVYISGPLFCPDVKLVRQPSMKDCEFSTICQKPPSATNDRWSNLLYNFEGHSEGITDIQFSPDSTLIATTSKDATVKLWNTDSGVLRCTITEHERPAKIKFSPDGTLLAMTTTSSNHHEVWVWHVSTVILLHKFETQKTFNEDIYIAFFPCGDRLAAAVGKIGEIYVWQISSAQEVCSYKIDCQFLCDIDVSHDGLLLAAAFDDGFGVYDARNGRLLAREKSDDDPDRIVVATVTFSFDDTFILYKYDYGTSWFNRHTRKWHQKSHITQRGTAVSDFVPNSNQLGMYHSAQAHVDIIDLDTGSLVRSLTFTTGFSSFRFSPTQPYLICASLGREASTWNLGEASNESFGQEIGKVDAPNVLYFSDCGSLLFAHCRGSWTRLYNLQDLGRSFETLLKDGDVLQSSIHPVSGVAMVVSYPAFEGQLNAPTYCFLNKRRLDAQRPRIVVFSPSGNLLLVGEYKTHIHVFQTTSTVPELLDTITAHKKTLRWISFQPDGSTFSSIAFGERLIKQWSTSSRQLIRTIALPDPPARSAISPDGQHLAVLFWKGEPAGRIEIYNLKADLMVKSIESENIIGDIVYDEDGSYLKSSTSQWEAVKSPTAKAKHAVSDRLTIRGRWVYQGETKLIWIPPEYGATIRGIVHDRTVAIWHTPTSKLLFFKVATETRQSSLGLAHRG